MRASPSTPEGVAAVGSARRWPPRRPALLLALCNASPPTTAPTTRTMHRQRSHPAGSARPAHWSARRSPSTSPARGRPVDELTELEIALIWAWRHTVSETARAWISQRLDAAWAPLDLLAVLLPPDHPPFPVIDNDTLQSLDALIGLNALYNRLGPLLDTPAADHASSRDEHRQRILKHFAATAAPPWAAADHHPPHNFRQHEAARHMTDNLFTLTPERWQRLISARQAYTDTVSPYYDETLQQVTQRACENGTIGKTDIGALLMWKRLRADTPWAAELTALADTDVRRVTAAAVTAVRDTSLSRSTSARAGRAALASLPGFRTGDALASAVLTAAAPDRMAIYDHRAHSALHTLGIPLSHTPGRYSRYMEAIDQLLAAAPALIRGWSARDMDTALYWLHHPTNTMARTKQHSTHLIDTGQD